MFYFVHGWSGWQCTSLNGCNLSKLATNVVQVIVQSRGSNTLAAVLPVSCELLLLGWCNTVPWAGIKLGFLFLLFIDSLAQFDLTQQNWSMHVLDTIGEIYKM